MKNVFMILGFVLFMTGFMSLCLSLIGVSFSLLSFLEHFSPLFGLLFKLGLIVVGMLIFIISRTDWKAENQR